MNNINSTVNNVLVDLMVKCMLNPDNKEFYIGNLSMNQVEYLCKTVCKQNTQAIDIFWKAFHIAEDVLREEEMLYQAYLEQITLDDMCCEYAKHGNNSYYGNLDRLFK